MEPLYLSLFFSTFLSATILPFSSELILGTTLLFSKAPLSCLVAASLGNCLGVTANYIIGKKGITYLLDKLNFDQKKRDFYHEKFKKYDKALLLVSWTPFFGDPITIYAGITKLPFVEFAAYAYTGRVLRYIVIYFLLTH